MRYLYFLIAGLIFGITLTKGEIISWYRIQEMFRFQGFHMYGTIGSAVIIGMIIIAIIKKTKLKSLYHTDINLTPKNPGYIQYILGGSIFGMGWAMVGACPGPMYLLFGSGFSVFIVVILSAILGTFVYGLIRHKLPH